MPPAIIAGGIAAAGTIGGALLSSHSQSKANEQAAQTQDNATAAQLQLGQQSLSQNRDIYNANYDLLSPYASRGNVAGTAINSLLGLPSAPVMHSPLAASATPAPTTSGTPPPAPLPGSGNPVYTPGTSPSGQGAMPYAAMNTAQEPTGVTPYQPSYPAPGTSTAPTSTGNFVPLKDRGDRPNMLDFSGDRAAFNTALDAWQHTNIHPVTPGAPGTTPTPSPAGGGVAATGGNAAGGANSAQSAMQNFANSAGMQFQLQQGTNALNNMYAAHGMLQSGAAMKGIQNYGQQTALNNYFMPYMSLLGGQQAVGAGAASSVAGVGANFGNTAAGINSQMGNAMNSGAQNIGNLQLANGQNQSNMYGTIGGALGGLASSFFPTPKY